MDISISTGREKISGGGYTDEQLIIDLASILNCRLTKGAGHSADLVTLAKHWSHERVLTHF